MSNREEYDAAYAATIAAAAYAISMQEQENSPAQKKPAHVEAPPVATPPKSPIKRGESMKGPLGGSKISRWFSASGKGPALDDDDDDNGPGANVSVRRPRTPAQGKPEGTASDQNVPRKVLDSTPSVKKIPSFPNKSLDRKASKKLEQEQAVQKAPSNVRPATSYHAARNGDATAVAASGGGETKADEWEKAKLAKIREEYEKMIETIAEWENEKKVKAKRQKEQKEIELDRKRAKALEEYSEEITRINKIVGGARSMAEERRRNDENKIRAKANKIRSTGKLPRSCGCF